MQVSRWGSALLLIYVIAMCAPLWAAGPTQTIDAYYRYDVPFPEFSPYWHDTSEREANLGLKLWDKPLAGSAHIYLKNTSSSPLEIHDVLLAGISLKQAIAFSDQDVRREADPASIYFSGLSEADRNKLISAGDPIWWRVQPQVVQPGDICEVAVRFRTNPPGGSVKLLLPVKGGKDISIDVPMKARPRIESISFSPSLDFVQAYCTTKAGQPKSVFIDGRDVTAQSKIAYDPAVDLAPVAISLGSPLKRGSFCCLQIGYASGVRATELIKVWNDVPVWGVWGGANGEEGDTATAKAYYDDLSLHSVSCQMEQIGSKCITSFLGTQEGRDYIKSLGIKRTVNEFAKQGTTEPYAFFLADEPESADFFVKGVPPGSLMGCMTQGMVNKAQGLYANDPVPPSMVNINRTFPPHSYYAYGLVADILQTDPYYQAALSYSFSKHSARAPRYVNAKSIYAMSKVPCSACAPHPLQLVLLSCGRSATGEGFRFPTPDEKRIEVYYALAAGAKQVSFWWYTPALPGQKGANGCGSQQPEAKALWREIGLLGAEFRTMDELIANGCAVDLPVSSPNPLWIKTIMSGRDTVILFCVTDDYASDRQGTVHQLILDAEASVTLPGWIDPKSAFEVTYQGTSDVGWDKAGRTVNIHLGKTHLTRMIVVTSDPQLRSRLQARYDEKCAANVAKLMAQSRPAP